MHHNHTIRFVFKAFQPIKESLLIRMSANSFQDFNFGIHGNTVPEKLHRLRPFNQLASQRSNRLVSHKTNRTLWTPQIVFQMVPDSSRFTHAGCRNNHLRLLVKVDQLRLLTGNRRLKTRKNQRVDSLSISSIDFCAIIIGVDSSKVIMVMIRVLMDSIYSDYCCVLLYFRSVLNCRTILF